MSEVLLLDAVTTQKKLIKVDVLTELIDKDKYYINRIISRKSLVRSINCYVLKPDATTTEMRECLKKFKPAEEVWRTSSMLRDDIVVSNYGRVARILKDGTRTIYQAFLKKHNPRLGVRVKLPQKRPDGTIKIVETPVGRLVARVYLNGDKQIPTGFVAIHKDKDRWNNRVSNLEILTSVEAGKYNRAAERARCVAKVSPWTGEIVDVYKSYAEAGRHNNMCRETIRQGANCEPKAMYGSHYWENISREEYYEIKERLLENM